MRPVPIVEKVKYLTNACRCVPQHVWEELCLECRNGEIVEVRCDNQVGEQGNVVAWLLESGVAEKSERVLIRVDW